MPFLYGLAVGLVVGLVGGWALCKHRLQLHQKVKEKAISHL